MSLFVSTNSDQGKSLRLLNGVALLLVTEAKSDVAAVTFIYPVHTKEVGLNPSFTGLRTEGIPLVKSFTIVTSWV